MFVIPKATLPGRIDSSFFLVKENLREILKSLTNRIDVTTASDGMDVLPTNDFHRAVLLPIGRKQENDISVI
jgi:hypothetical protein